MPEPVAIPQEGIPQIANPSGYKPEDVFFATDLPSSGKRLVMARGNVVFLEELRPQGQLSQGQRPQKGQAPKVRYDLKDAQSQLSFQQALMRDFKQAVKASRPLIEKAAESKISTPKPYLEAVAKYRQIVTDLQNLATQYGKIRQNNNALVVPQVARLFHQSHIPRIAREIAEFSKAYIEPSSKDSYATYKLRDGLVARMHENVFARGWRKIAGLFKVGRRYYEVKANKSLFDALTSKYSERDILEKINRIARTEKRAQPGFAKELTSFDENTFSKLSASAKLSLVESLEVMQRSVDGDAKVVANMKTKVPNLVKALSKKIPQEIAEVLAPAFYVSTRNTKTAYASIMNLSPQNRAKLAKDFTQGNEITEQLVTAFANKDKQKASNLLVKMYKLVLENAELVAGKKIDGMDELTDTAMAIFSRLFSMPRTKIDAAAERYLEWEDSFGKNIQLPIGWKEHLAPQSNDGLAITLLSVMARQLGNTMLMQVNSLKTTAPAKQTWREVMLHKVSFGADGGFKVEPSKTSAPLGSIKWRQMAANSKQQFLEAVRKRYLQGDMPLAQGKLSDVLNERLQEFDEAPFITRSQALDVVRHLSQEEELVKMTTTEQYPDRQRVKKALSTYEIDGADWVKLAEENGISPKDHKFHRMFYRRIQDNVFLDAKLLVALETAQAHRAENRDFGEEQQIAHKVANKMVIRLAHKAKNHPQDYQALLKLDEETYDLMDNYVVALQNGNFKKLAKANQDLSGAVIRYLTLDPTLNPFADDSAIATRSPEELQVTGEDIRKVARIITFEPLAEMSFAHVNKVFAENKNQVGYIMGALSAYSNKMFMDFNDDVQSIHGDSSDSEDELVSSAGSTPPSSRPSSSVFGSARNMEILMALRGDLAAQRRRGIPESDRARSSIFTGEHMTLTAIPRNASPKMVSDREQVDLKAALRSYSDNLFASMIRALQFASPTKGDLKDAEDTDMGFEDTKTSTDMGVSEYLAEEVTEAPALGQPPNEAIAHIEIDTIPSAAQRQKLLEDFDPLNKAQGIPLRNLFQRLQGLHKAVLDDIAEKPMETLVEN